MHHRWQERLGESRNRVGSIDDGSQRRDQCTCLNHFPTKSIMAHDDAEVAKLTGTELTPGAGVAFGLNTVSSILQALQPVRDRVFERLVFRAPTMPDGQSGAPQQAPVVADGSVLIAIGPVNVIGFTLERIRNLLQERTVSHCTQ